MPHDAVLVAEALLLLVPRQNIISIVIHLSKHILDGHRLAWRDGHSGAGAPFADPSSGPVERWRRRWFCAGRECACQACERGSYVGDPRAMHATDRVLVSKVCAVTAHTV